MSTATNRLVQTLSEINPDELPSFSPIGNSTASNASNASNGSSGSFMDYFSGITWQTWLIIILILAFLGINVFSYLGKGTDELTKIFAPILKIFGYETLETTKQTVDVSATGTKAGVDIVADTTTGAINTIEGSKGTGTKTETGSGTKTNTVVGQQAASSLSINNAHTVQNQMKLEKQMNELEDMQQDNLHKALDDASKGDGSVKPDDSLSRIQSSNSGKAGWCFIGEDRGFRTCSEIGQNDKCMSGDIFPSNEICMNPNLRP